MTAQLERYLSFLDEFGGRNVTQVCPPSFMKKWGVKAQASYHGSNYPSIIAPLPYSPCSEDKPFVVRKEYMSLLMDIVALRCTRPYSLSFPPPFRPFLDGPVNTDSDGDDDSEDGSGPGYWPSDAISATYLLYHRKPVNAAMVFSGA